MFIVYYVPWFCEKLLLLLFYLFDNEFYSSERTQQRKTKLDKFLKMKAFFYNPETDYELKNNISIDLMDNECSYCKALKYNIINNY